MATSEVDTPSTSSNTKNKNVKLPSKVWQNKHASLSSPESQSRGSPEPCCAICLGKPDNKSFTNTCLHQFCFTCLKEWSKVKPECPLCKQRFKAIIHNVRSNDEYEEYRVKSPEPEQPLYDLLRFRFHYRTTLTPERREELAMQRRFAFHHFAQEGFLPTDRSSLTSRRLQNCRLQGTSAFRRSRYERDLWVKPLSDVTGRFREASPEFFRNNPAMTHRLVPWLNRELTVLLPHQPNRLAFVLELILGLLNRHHILSRAFRETMEPYTGGNTAHFVHEFHCFARSPYDMFGFDENVQYGPRSHLSHEEVGISELSESDIEVLSPQRTASQEAQPSRDDSPASPQPGPSGLQRTFRISSTEEDSDTEERPAPTRRDSISSGEVELVQVVKPRRERTPEIITITDSESESSSVEVKTPQNDRGKSLKRRLSSSSSTSTEAAASEDEPRAKKKIHIIKPAMPSGSRNSEKKKKRREKKSRRHRSRPEKLIIKPRDERSSAPSRGYWDLEPEELEEYRSGSGRITLGIFHNEQEEYRSGSSTTSSNTEPRDKRKHSKQELESTGNERKDKRNKRRYPS